MAKTTDELTLRVLELVSRCFGSGVSKVVIARIAPARNRWK